MTTLPRFSELRIAVLDDHGSAKPAEARCFTPHTRFHVPVKGACLALTTLVWGV